jgi:hypothetical protein
MKGKGNDQLCEIHEEDQTTLANLVGMSGAETEAGGTVGCSDCAWEGSLDCPANS